MKKLGLDTVLVAILASITPPGLPSPARHEDIGPCLVVDFVHTIDSIGVARFIRVGINDDMIEVWQIVTSYTRRVTTIQLADPDAIDKAKQIILDQWLSLGKPPVGARKPMKLLTCKDEPGQV